MSIRQIDRRALSRQRFFESYVESVLNEEVRSLLTFERPAEMRSLLTVLAERCAQLLNYSQLAQDLGLPTTTLRRYVAILEQTFLATTIPAWSNSMVSRATKNSKIYIVDSALAAYLQEHDESSLLETPHDLGHLVENFVAGELTRELSWISQRAQLFHYRNRDGVEVDFVIQGTRHRIVGIEVKLSRTVRSSDFRGLDHLQRNLGNKFVQGVVLYLGDTVVPFGPNLFAVPIGCLWQ